MNESRVLNWVEHGAHGDMLDQVKTEAFRVSMDC